MDFDHTKQELVKQLHNFNTFDDLCTSLYTEQMVAKQRMLMYWKVTVLENLVVKDNQR